MFDQLVMMVSAEKELLLLLTLLVFGAGIYAKVSIHRVMMYCALFFCGATTLLLAFGDGALEIPAAEVMANSTLGWAALVALTIGVKCAATASGFYECSWAQEFGRGFMFVGYSVLLSTIGQSAIFADADVNRSNVKAHIASLEQEKSTLNRSLNGYPSCASQRWCNSQAKERRVAAINVELSSLRSKDSITTSEAMGPTAKKLSALPFLGKLTAEDLVFWTAFIRTLVATYATMFMSHLTAQCYYALTGRRPKKLGRRGPKRAKFGPRLGQSRAKSGPGFFSRLFGGKRGVSDKKFTDQKGVEILGHYFSAHGIPSSKARRADAQRAFAEYRNGVAINNDRAMRILKLYKQEVESQGV